MDEHGDRSCHVDGAAQPAIVLGIAEHVGVGADQTPAGGVDREAIAAPRVDERGESLGALLVLAVEADVVIAGDRHQRAGQVGEHGAGEAAVVDVVGILVDDVAGEGDQVGRLRNHRGEQPAQRRRKPGDGRQVRVGELQHGDCVCVVEVGREHRGIVAHILGLMATTLMVWIDQDLCTGDGICSEICPDVFVGRDDGLWVVKEEASHFGSTIVFDGVDGAGHGPDGGKGVARIPDSLIDSAVEAAEECPGECIMIEPYDQAAIDARGRSAWRRFSGAADDKSVSFVA